MSLMRAFSEAAGPTLLNACASASSSTPPRVVRSLTIPTVLALCSGCQCPPSTDYGAEAAVPVDGLPATQVASLEIVPGVVHVFSSGAGVSFQVSARLRNLAGQLIPPSAGPPAPIWDWVASSIDNAIIAPGILTQPMAGHNTTVKLPSVTSATRLKLKATGGSASDEAEVVVVVKKGDRIEAGHTDGDPPSVALVDAEADGCLSALRGVPIAFVGVATTGCDNEDVASKVTVFRPKKRVVHLPATWTKDDLDEVLTVGDPGAPISVRAKIWVPVGTPFDAVLEAQAQMQLATSIYGRSLTGITPDVDGTITPGVLESVDVNTLDPNWDCSGVPDQVTGVTFAPKQLTVLYTRGLRAFPGGGGSGGRGVACHPHATHGTVVLLDIEHAFPNDLAHELSHTMGSIDPPLPADGHTQWIGGFSHSGNLMLTYLPANELQDRDHLTLGQAFRMNLDVRSWVNVAARSMGDPILGRVVSCQCDPYWQQPCPMLKTDIVAHGSDLIVAECPSIVHVFEEFFFPTTKIVNVGDRVVWRWLVAKSHSVTFTSGPSAPAMSSGEWNRSFPSAGDYPYKCTVPGHTETGTVSVVTPP